MNCLKGRLTFLVVLSAEGLAQLTRHIAIPTKPLRRACSRG